VSQEIKATTRISATRESRERPRGRDESHNRGDRQWLADRQTVSALIARESDLSGVQGCPGRRGWGHSLSLAMETAVVAIITVTAVRFLNEQHALHIGWLAVPCLLVGAALLPTWLRKRDFPPIGLQGRSMLTSLGLASLTGICFIPAALGGLWLATRVHLSAPPSSGPTVATPQGWFIWLVYQFMYVAAAEEVFFRGYLQSNMTALIDMLHPSSRRFNQCATAIISAGCFAAAHVIAQGQIIALATFLPGLVLAWLFIRTRTLLAPILFHGLANVSYGLFALIWMY
jgi:membrane protease YdiL (CAAX protease family)